MQERTSVTNLCNFLELPNNAVIVSADQEAFSDEKAIMFVNNANVLMRVNASGGEPEPLIWDGARESLAKTIRKLKQGFVTMARFQPDNMGMPGKGMTLGQQFHSSSITGTQPPALMIIIGLAVLATVAYLLMPKERAKDRANQRAKERGDERTIEIK